jgi:hypothetical protein
MKKKRWKARALDAERALMDGGGPWNVTINVGDRQLWRGIVDNDDLLRHQVTIRFDPDHVRAVAADARKAGSPAVSGWSGFDPEHPYPGLICPADSPGWSVFPPVDLT